MKLSGISREFIPSVRVVVIGHFSLDGELKDEQYCIPPMHNIFLSRCEEDLLKNIISKLSHDGQVVLDAVSENGMLLVNTFVAAVCIYHIQCVLSVFTRKIERATAYFLNLGDKCDPLSENPAHPAFYENRDKTGNRYVDV